jgi:hypothetical protein
MVAIQGRGGMKGQLVFEFVIAAMFFLGIIMYTINYLNSTVFLYSSDYYVNTLESKAWQASEVLVRNEGVWSGSPPSMVPSVMGLAEDWPVLNESKIQGLNQFCVNYRSDVMRLLDINPELHGIRLEINESGGSSLLECGSLPRGIQSAMVSRFGVSESGNLLKVRVWYW